MIKRPLTFRILKRLERLDYDRPIDQAHVINEFDIILSQPQDFKSEAKLMHAVAEFFLMKENQDLEIGSVCHQLFTWIEGYATSQSNLEWLKQKISTGFATKFANLSSDNLSTYTNAIAFVMNLDNFQSICPASKVLKLQEIIGNLRNQVYQHKREIGRLKDQVEQLLSMRRVYQEILFTSVACLERLFELDKEK